MICTGCQWQRAADPEPRRFPLPYLLSRCYREPRFRVCGFPGRLLKKGGGCLHIGEVRPGKEAAESGGKRSKKAQGDRGIYRAVFDASEDAFLLSSVEGRILECNRAACRLYGYTRREILTRRLTDPPSGTTGGHGPRGPDGGGHDQGSLHLAER